VTHLCNADTLFDCTNPPPSCPSVHNIHCFHDMGATVAKLALPLFTCQRLQGLPNWSQQFGTFLRAYWEEPLLQQAILCTQNECKGFSESWVVTTRQFPLVQQFCGGLASALPNTASVELNFSVIA
jgi:hypothetical protein